jgi:hypothetical protein
MRFHGTHDVATLCYINQSQGGLEAVIWKALWVIDGFTQIKVNNEVVTPTGQDGKRGVQFKPGLTAAGYIEGLHAAVIKHNNGIHGAAFGIDIQTHPGVVSRIHGFTLQQSGTLGSLKLQKINAADGNFTYWSGAWGYPFQ